MLDEGEKGERFRFRWMTVRHAGRARRLSRLSMAALFVPLIAYGIGGALGAETLLALGSPLDLAMSLFVMGTLGSILMALGSVVVARERVFVPGDIVIRGDRVAIDLADRVEHMGRRRIEGGLLITKGLVELYLADGRILRAELRTEGDARALLDRLGVGPAGRRLVAPEASTNRVLGMGCLAFPIAFVLFANLIVALDHLFGGARPLILTVLVIVSTLLARRLARGAEIVVGAEGVALRSVGSTPRFVRFDEIARVLRSGRVLTIVTHADGGQAHASIREACADADVAEGLSARILEGAARARERRGEAQLAEVLAPRDRSIIAWREALRGVARGGDRYRSAAVVAEDLLSVVEDASAPKGARIGAAIALRERIDDSERARVRIAADACADPGLREALEAAAAEEDPSDAVIRRAIS
jgi:hypothetical protein